MVMTTEEFLEHHGVKGQKWGVRRKRDGTPKKTSSDHKKTSELKKRGPSSLTNKQLKSVNERSNLVSNFNKSNPGKRQRGEAHVKALLGTAALAVSVYSMANSPAGKAGISAAKKLLTTKSATKIASIALPSDAYLG